MAFQVGYWTGAASGSWNDDDNWLNVHPDPVAPADNGVFDGRSQVHVTANANHSLAELLGDIIIGPKYGGIIASSAAPLQLSCANLVMRGTGHLYFENGSVSDTARVVVNAPSGGAHLGCNTAKIDVIEALAGEVILTSTLTGLLELYVKDANVTIESANAIAAVHVFGGGDVTCLAPVTKINHWGSGTWRQIKEAGAITTMRIGRGATLQYDCAGTITLAMVHDGGMFDTGDFGDALVVSELWRGPDAKIVRRDQFTATIENPL